MPPETPEDFLVLLVRGLREDAELLVSRLNQATLDLYGEAQCLANLPALLNPEAEMEIREIGDPEDWDYEIDGVVTPIEDAVPVEVERVIGGQTFIQEVHWKLVDGIWTWFTDCGDPL